MKTLSFCAVLLAFSIVGLSTRLLAQADRGAIKGEVQDSQKANIPAAKITLKEESTGVVLDTVLELFARHRHLGIGQLGHLGDEVDYVHAEPVDPAI